MHLPSLSAVTLLAGLLVAGNPALAQTQKAGPLPSVTLPPELDRVLRDYEREWQGKNPAGVAALFTEDGMALANGRPPAQGRAAIMDAYSNAGGVLKLRGLAYATGDTVGYIIGAFRFNADTADAGKFVLALRRSPRGRWLIAADMDNSIRPSR